MKKKRTNSVEKGKRGERELVGLLKSLGFDDAERTEQHCGRNGDSDVRCPKSLPNIHFESKYGYPGMDHGTKLLDDARAQAASECGEKAPVVLWRPPRKCWRMDYSVDGQHWVTLDSTESMREALQLMNDQETVKKFPIL